VVDIDADRMDCVELDDAEQHSRRARAWREAVDANGGVHPDAAPVSSRVLARMRATARPALRGAGMAVE
jgi:dihydroxy-acid dehydratase